MVNAFDPKKVRLLAAPFFLAWGTGGGLSPFGNKRIVPLYGCLNIIKNIVPLRLVFIFISALCLAAML